MPGTYRESGVDLEEAGRAVSLIRESVRSTFDGRVLSDVGSFGGLFRPHLSGMENPVLAASTDGVGTKMKVASMTGRYGTVGRDLVNHCVNDILVQGAEPLFFLDYIACGRLSSGVVSELVEGLAAACRENGCALLGGETAEMPGFYAEGDYDLAGTVVGMVEHDRIVDGSGIRPGDAVIGLPSSGLHTNGYSLARRVLFETAGLRPEERPDDLGGESVADALLAVHRSYLAPVGELLGHRMVRGLAHVTGGGLAGNLSRVLPGGCGAVVERSWEEPPVFRLIRRLGEVDEAEMERVFNLGAGMLAVVPGEEADFALSVLREAGEAAFVAGRVVDGGGVEVTGGCRSR